MCPFRCLSGQGSRQRGQRQSSWLPKDVVDRRGDDIGVSRTERRRQPLLNNIGTPLRRPGYPPRVWTGDDPQDLERSGQRHE